MKYLQMIYPISNSYPTYMQRTHNSTSKKKKKPEKMGRGPE